MVEKGYPVHRRYSQDAEEWRNSRDSEMDKKHLTHREMNRRYSVDTEGRKDTGMVKDWKKRRASHGDALEMRTLKKGKKENYVDGVTIIFWKENEQEIRGKEETNHTQAQREENGTQALEKKGSQRENYLEMGRLIEVREECKALRQMLFLAVAFSANTGGTGFPLGCGPNIIFMGLLER